MSPLILKLKYFLSQTKIIPLSDPDFECSSISSPVLQDESKNSNITKLFKTASSQAKRKTSTGVSGLHTREKTSCIDDVKNNDSNVTLDSEIVIYPPSQTKILPFSKIDFQCSSLSSPVLQDESKNRDITELFQTASSHAKRKTSTGVSGLHTSEKESCIDDVKNNDSNVTLDSEIVISPASQTKILPLSDPDIQCSSLSSPVLQHESIPDPIVNVQSSSVKVTNKESLLSTTSKTCIRPLVNSRLPTSAGVNEISQFTIADIDK